MTAHDERNRLQAVARQCAICGRTSEQIAIGSLVSLGEPDLDLRPAEMLRSAIAYEAQQCPTCGYRTRDISLALPDAEETLASSAYWAQTADPDYPDLANDFLCQALLEEAGGLHAQATWSTLQAAWACDDAGAQAAALACRHTALERLDLAVAAGQPLGDTPVVDDLLLVDLLRRTDQRDAASDACDEALARQDDEVIAAVFTYQRTLCEAGDTGCHTIDEALAAVLGWGVAGNRTA